MNFLATIPPGADMASRMRKTLDEIGNSHAALASDQADEETLLEFEAEVTATWNANSSRTSRR